MSRQRQKVKVKMKCENCGEEHDGSYGSGRFCSKKCRGAFSAKKLLNRGISRKWICKWCGLEFSSRKKMYNHVHEIHGTFVKHSWNSGLTKETSQHIANGVSKIQKAIIKAYAEGRLTGRASTPEKEKLRKERMSISALNRKVPSVCKRTEPYLKKDGSIVNLDSSYERIIAKILDEHDIKWIRPSPLDWYSSDGIKHHYFPDFYLTEYDLYLDPKNDYCFKVQAEKISYIKEHYNNCIFITKDQLTWDFLQTFLE